MSARAVAQMPINGRQISQLYLLATGAQTAGGGMYDNIRFSGRSNQQNAVRFDVVEASSLRRTSKACLAQLFSVISGTSSATGFAIRAAARVSMMALIAL